MQQSGDDFETLTFALRLQPGSGADAVAEYRRRHDTLWPEMRSALLDAGVIEYEIHLERESRLLFAWMRVRKDHRLASLPESEVWQRWQAHMADLLVTENGRPVRVEIERVFRLVGGG
jgi:L-rhamnose mutarotase